MNFVVVSAVVEAMARAAGRVAAASAVAADRPPDRQADRLDKAAEVESAAVRKARMPVMRPERSRCALGVRSRRCRGCRCRCRHAGANGAGGNANAQNRNANPAAGGGLDVNQDPLAAAAAEAQAAVQPGVPNDGDGAGDVPQAAATGANESFLMNGSISTGLNTQAGDFAPGGGQGFGPGGPGGGFSAATSGGSAAALGGALAAGGANVATAQGGGIPGGGGGGFGGGGFGGGGRGGGGGGRGGGGRAGGRGGRGGAGFIGNRRNAGRSQIRGSFFYTLGNSALDAAPFSINGQANTKAAFAQNRFGFNVGGPLEIPKLLNLENTFFFINYTGSLQRSGQNLTGTVPTLAERGGDFSAATSTIYMPSPQQFPNAPAGCTSATPMPFTNNMIPGNCISSIVLGTPQVKGLLGYIPLPNQPGTINNYRFVTATPNNSQALNTRVLQTLSRKDQLGFGVNWQGRDAINPQLFGFTDSSTGNGISANANWRHTIMPGMFNNICRCHSTATNQHGHASVFREWHERGGGAGDSGDIVEPDQLRSSESQLHELRPGLARTGALPQSAVYNVGFNDTLAWRKGKHNWSFGGGYTRYFNNTVTDANGRGTFTFTGLSTSQLDANGNVVAGTGYDFADFLLGLPDANSIRYGSSNTYFRSQCV